MMTYRTLCRVLREHGIDNAEGEAAILLEAFCGIGRAEIVCDPDRSYINDTLDQAVKRRISHEPLQYILGEWSFFDETYTVTPDCLIPRSDTEILVEQAIRTLPPNARFIDLCTGSGCIAISTLAHRPDCHAHAVDLFPATLALAQKNAERNGVSDRITFRCADVLDPSFPQENGPFDAILSNPPYIPTTVVDSLKRELFAEPRAALDGGEDGLIFYRAITAFSSRLLTQNGFILFEIGYDQQESIKKIATSCGFTCNIERDLSGNPRVARLSKGKEFAWKE